MGRCSAGCGGPGPEGVGHREEGDEADAVKRAEETDASGAACARGLEDRRLAEQCSLRHSAAPAADSSSGVFSTMAREFTYTTPTGGHAVIQVVGPRQSGRDDGRQLGGALNLVYGGTNAYSKIVSHVTGATAARRWPASCNSQLIAAGAANSVSGVGGNVIQAVYLNEFDLIAGGNINLTPGVNTLVLDSVGPDTQIQPRALPPPRVRRRARRASPRSWSCRPKASTVRASLKAVNAASAPSDSESSSSSANTLEAGQSTTRHERRGDRDVQVDGNGGQTLTRSSGTFTAGTNIVEPLPAGQPSQTPPPAPPGVILKVNQVNGAASSPINLLTDPKIFGYDPTTGQVIRFDLNLINNTGRGRSTFTPISVPGDPASVGLNLGYNGNQLDVLVSSGTTVYAYNATTGARGGLIHHDRAGQCDRLDRYGHGSGQLRDQPAPDDQPGREPASRSAQYRPRAIRSLSHRRPAFTLLGGLTGVPGSTTVTATVGATFDTFQPTQTSSAFRSIDTDRHRSNSSTLSYKFAAGDRASAFTQNGAYTPVQTNPPDRDAARARPWGASIKASRSSPESRTARTRSALVVRDDHSQLPRSPDRPERGLPPRSDQLGTDRHPGRCSVGPRRSATGMVFNDNGQPQPGQVQRV